VYRLQQFWEISIASPYLPRFISPRIQIVAGPGSDLPPGLRRWRDECVFESTKLPSMAVSTITARMVF
jgi:hypothetical protein